MEEEEGKVRHISQQEAREIDATKVAYFTLNDGTVLLVKNDDNPEPQEILQENQRQQPQQQEDHAEKGSGRDARLDGLLPYRRQRL